MTSEKSGVGYETISSLRGIEQLDLFDSENAIVLARGASGGLDLRLVALP